MRQAFAFLGIHVILIAVMSGSIGQIISHISSGLVLFFAFYMFIEPITSPVKPKGKIFFGLITGVLGALLYVIWLPGMLIGALFLADLVVPFLNKVRNVKTQEVNA